VTREELQRRLAMQAWTSHNIRLAPDLTTLPGAPDFLKTDARLTSILRTLSLLYQRRLAELRAADLGCLEGGFALALAQHGMEVLGVEARQTNLEKALLLKEYFALPNLTFVRDDVKRFTQERYGTFDVVLALGILYHLDAPVSWLHQLSELTRGALVIESHYAPADDPAFAMLHPQFKQRLGPIETMEANGDVYEGRWFLEYEEDADRDRESHVWSSYSNCRSFWLTKESLLRAVLRGGFDALWEQHDYSAASYRLYNLSSARGLFYAIRSQNVLARPKAAPGTAP
jgi:Methyltransferase domain